MWISYQFFKIDMIGNREMNGSRVKKLYTRNFKLPKLE